MMFVPQNSAHVVYSTTRYAVFWCYYFLTVLQLGWLPEYQSPQKSRGRRDFAPDPTGGACSAPPYSLAGGRGHIPFPRTLPPLSPMRHEALALRASHSCPFPDFWTRFMPLGFCTLLSTCNEVLYFLEYKPGLKYKPGLEYKLGSWFTYWSSLTSMHCLHVISVNHGTIWSYQSSIWTYH